MALDWSLLTNDVLGKIALKLGTFEDFSNFSRVCHGWNHAGLCIKYQWKHAPVPWLLLAENTDQNPNHVRRIFNMGNYKCCELKLPETFGTRCWGSPYGWLVMASRDLSIRLFNPITKAEIRFPSVEDNLYLPQFYGSNDYEEFPHDCLVFFLTKLILLQTCRGEFIVMALYAESGGLSYARQGDHSWKLIYAHKKRDHERVVDIIAVEDRVFAIYEDGAIRYWNNVNELDAKPLDYSLDGINIVKNSKRSILNMYLLHSSNSKLLVVLRYMDHLLKPETDGFKVYQVNPIEKRWVEIKDLGDAALFVGNNSSMSVSTLGAKCLERRNCIYFTDDANMCWELLKQFAGHDMGVYDIKSDKLCRFYNGVDVHSTFCPPLWFIPQL